MALLILNSVPSLSQTPSCAVPVVLPRKLNQTYKGAIISIEYPEIPGESAFNKAVLGDVNAKVKRVKELADVDASAQPFEGRHGSVGSQYTVTHSRTGTLSALMEYGLEASTSVHPGTELTSLNYDLCNHRLFRLEYLFRPAAPYLATISRISIQDLQNRQLGDIHQIRVGAAPSKKNFSTFTLDDDSLIIHFQQYQVTAGAAGVLSVKIPLEELRPILKKRFLPQP